MTMRIKVCFRTYRNFSLIRGFRKSDITAFIFIVLYKHVQHYVW